MANKVSFGMRRAQLSTHFLFGGKVWKIHHFCQLPLCVVPKSCTHHLTHNNNNLLSHKEKKGGKTRKTARLVHVAPAAGRQTCTLVCLPGEWWQMSIGSHAASPTCALLWANAHTHTDVDTPVSGPSHSLSWYCITFPFDVKLCFHSPRLSGRIVIRCSAKRASKRGRRHCLAVVCLFWKMFLQ